MGIIRELDPDLINKIAAGEVIESAHSVIKELLENATDSGATQIDIETSEGGLEKILVADNGSGISKEDLPLALRRHATSKIKSLNDLESVETYGFRGEALASIASVSRMSITSGTKESPLAYSISSEKGENTVFQESGSFSGTKVEVRDLFFNTPVRRKFLKSERSEDKKIKDRVTIQALAREDVGFRYVQNGKEVLNVFPESKKERIISLFGENFRNHLLEVNLERKGIRATGFIGDPDFYRSNRNGQFIFVNNRPIEIKYSSYLLKKCYDELLPSGAHPWAFLFFEIDPHHVDVNVHPTKKEIRFLDEEGFNAFFITLINSELRSKTPVSFLELKRRLSQPIPARQNSFLVPNQTNTEFQQILHADLYASPQRVEGFSLDQVGSGSQMDALTDDVKKNPDFIPKKHFGILFETFILAEAQDGLYIIDQHTAHERIRYEEVLRSLKRKSYGKQTLLMPMKLDFSKEEAEEILERADALAEIGIVVESFGEGNILVREVPGYMEAGHEKDTILDFLEKTTDKTDEKEVYDLMAKCVACRSAIKKGDHLSDHVLGEILNRLSFCDNPSRCPHGRPTLVKLTKDDLERMFHRK